MGKKKKGLELEERKAAVVAKTKAQLKAEAAAAAAKKKAADDAKAKKAAAAKAAAVKAAAAKAAAAKKTPRSVKTEEVIVRDNGTVVKNKSSTQQKGEKFEGHFF